MIRIVQKREGSQHTGMYTHKKIISCWTGAVSAACIIGIFLIYDDFGITWDESVQSQYGELALDYYASGLRDDACNSFLNLKYYGPLFEMACALVYRIADDLKFEIRHICTGLAAALTVIGVVKIGSWFPHPVVPVFSSIALIMLPRYFGHAFNNSKDIPFACGFVWTIAAMIILFQEKEFRWKSVILAGIILGLTLSIRVGGVILIIYYGIISVFWYFTKVSDGIERRNLLGIWAVKTTALLLIAWLMMVLTWPWAHINPIGNPLEALGVATQFAKPHSILFEGNILESHHLPWYYLLKYVIITTPLTLLTVAIIGLFSCAKTLVTNIKSAESLTCFTIIMWLTFPVAFFAIKTPNIYDGIRHFLFIQPAIAILCGIGAYYLFQRLRMIMQPVLAYIAITVLALYPIPDLIALHPYQMTYFNRLFGGLAEASKNYETDYWLSSYKEAAEWINQHKKPGDGGKTRVLLAANNHSRLCADYYFDDDIETASIFATKIPGDLAPGIAYYVATTRYGLDQNFPETPVVHTIGRNNAIYTVIKQRKRE